MFKANQILCDDIQWLFLYYSNCVRSLGGILIRQEKLNALHSFNLFKLSLLQGILSIRSDWIIYMSIFHDAFLNTNILKTARKYSRKLAEHQQ